MFERLSSEQASEFASDGVVLLQNAIEPRWIDHLTQGLTKNIARPTHRGRIWDRDVLGRTCFYDSQAWRIIVEYRDFIENSPIAKIAANALQTNRVNFFFDAVFVRSPGTQFRTPFHQDEPYWSIKGFDTCSIWMPLVPVEKRSALEFVAGSHLWRQQFRQINFAKFQVVSRSQKKTGEGERRDAQGEVYEEFPDIEGSRERYNIVSWNMNPGDCVIFNGRTIHGGSGHLAKDRDLKVFNTQWLGDDVRVCVRSEGMEPDHSSLMRSLGLRPGERIGTDTYPEFKF